MFGNIGRFLGILAVVFLGGWATAQAQTLITSCDETTFENAVNNGGVITFALDCQFQPETGLNIAKNTTIDGAGHTVVLDAVRDFGNVLSVHSGVTLTLNNLTIQNASFDVAVFSEGTLIVTNCAFLNNRAAEDVVGAIATEGPVTVLNSTFSGNSGTVEGAIGGATAMVIIINSTFSGNSGPDGVIGGRDIRLINTILAGNSGGNCAEQLTDGGYNLADDSSCFSTSGSTHSTVTTTAAIHLGSIQNNGGHTETIVPGGSSLAIDAIPAGTNGCATTVTTDQIGQARPGSLDGKCTIGAYEVVAPVAATITDCTDDGALRTAVGNGGRIVFACGGDIPLGGTLTIGHNTAIDASGQSVTLDGANSVTVLTNNATLTLNQLTIAHGNGAGNFGGGVFNNGNLIVTNSTFNNNTATGGGAGGGIGSFGVSAVVSNSTFFTNSASGGGAGGGIGIGNGDVIVTNSTFFLNTGFGGGAAGGIANFGGNSLTVSDSTFLDNSASGGGAAGGIAHQNPTTITNSVFVTNVGGSCDSGVTDGGYNLADDATCGFSESTSKVSTTAAIHLGGLQDNGGPTMTILPGTGSPAIGAIPFTDNGCGTTLLSDQRGIFRPQLPASGAGTCDIGAVQTTAAPVLGITKTHNGSLTQGDTADIYTITVVNMGPGPAVPILTLADTLPAGMTATAMVGAGWTCIPSTATCTRTSAMAVGERDAIALTVKVGYGTATGTNAVTNSVTVSGGNITTQTATDPTTVNQGPGYVLTTNVNPAGGGTVTANPTNSAGLPAGHYVPGAVVTLTANPGGAYGFTGWSGSVDLSSTSANPTTITMNSATENVTANFALVNGATFLPLDTTTQGNWPGVYGQDGYIIANGANNTPSYATVQFTGDSTWTWQSPSADPRALLAASTGTSRIASTFYSGSSYSIDVNLTDGALHEIALYLLDFDTTSRSETITILNAANQSVLDTRSFSNFHGGVWAVWKVSGHISIQVANTGLPNAVVSGIFFGTLSSPPAGPAVTIYTPTPNQTVSGDITLSANVTAAAGVQSVQFVLDNTTNLGPLIPGNGATYTYLWNSATVPNGMHTLKVTGIDNLSQTGSSSVSFNVSNGAAPSASAVFKTADPSTQGNWVGTYGGDGFWIANDASSSAPVYTAINFNGASTYTWNSSTSDPRALLVSPTGSASNRIASTYYSNTSFTIDLNLTDNQAHQVALYLLDYDDSRSETISIADANNTSNVLNTQSASNFQNGKYLVWTIEGHVLITVTTTGGLNGVVSGLFFASPSSGPQPNPVVNVTAPTPNQQVSGKFTVQATATSTGSIASVQFYVDDGALLGPPITQGVNSTYSYVWDTTTIGNGPHTIQAKAIDNMGQSTLTNPVPISVSNVPQGSNSASSAGTDTITQGNWKGVYGGMGEIIANDSNNPPSYAVVSFPGANLYTWGFTSDPRAPFLTSSTTERIASAYYNSPGFSIDVNFTDGNTHQLALYLLDWDHEGRTETIQIVDASNTSHVLNTQSASGFGNGTYYIWNITGHVVIQIAQTAGQNAVVSSLFFQ